MISRKKSISDRRGGTNLGLSLSTRISNWRKYFVPAALILLASLSLHLYHEIAPDNNINVPGGYANNTLSIREGDTHQVDPTAESLTFTDNKKLANKGAPSPTDTATTKRHLSQQYLEHLRGLESLPKKLHILFPHKDYYKKEPASSLPFVKHGILRFIELNPSWDVTVHDDADMDRIISKAADDGIISVEEKIILLGDESHPAAHPVERADLARLLIMWYYGGMYFDADSLINPKDFSKVFGPTTIKLCLPLYIDVNFAQSIVCSSPKNRLHMKMIEEMSRFRMESNNGGPIERRGGWAKRNSLFSMGPPMFNRIVFKFVFHENIRGTGDIPGMEKHMRWLQEEAGDVIVTGQFKDWCHSFIADPYEGCKGWDREDLYKLYNMSRWGETLQERWA